LRHLGLSPFLAELGVSEPLLPLESGPPSGDQRPLGESVSVLVGKLGLCLDDVGLLRDGCGLGSGGGDCLCALESGLPSGDGLRSDAGKGLDDFLDLRLVVDGLGELGNGGDPDGFELLHVVRGHAGEFGQ